MSDDQALLIRYARSRDAGAFAQLVKRYSTLVFSVALRVTRNATTAEDVTQDCFLRLARQAASIRGSLPGWLHRVALNRSLDVKRNEAVRKRHETCTNPQSDSGYDPDWHTIAPYIDEAIAKLPDDLREPLVQHFLLGQTQIQVAQNLHIDQATVSRRVQMAVEVLRTNFQKAGISCGALVLSADLAHKATHAVPAQLSISLMKIAVAGLSGAPNISAWTFIKGVIMKKSTCAIVAATALAAVSISMIVAKSDQSEAARHKRRPSKRTCLAFHF